MTNIIESLNTWSKIVARIGFSLLVGGALVIIAALALEIDGAFSKSFLAVAAGAVLIWPGLILLMRGIHIYTGLEPSSSQLTKKPGPFHEQDGSLSMRRISAAACFLIGAILFGIGAVIDHQYAFWGGTVSTGAGVLLLLFTTWSDISGFTQSVLGAVPSVSGVVSLLKTSSTIDHSNPPIDPSEASHP